MSKFRSFEVAAWVEADPAGGDSARYAGIFFGACPGRDAPEALNFAHEFAKAELAAKGFRVVSFELVHLVNAELAARSTVRGGLDVARFVLLDDARAGGDGAVFIEIFPVEGVSGL